MWGFPVEWYPKGSLETLGFASSGIAPKTVETVQRRVSQRSPRAALSLKDCSTGRHWSGSRHRGSLHNARRC